MNTANIRQLIAAMRAGGYHDLELEIDHERLHLVLEPLAPAVRAPVRGRFTKGLAVSADPMTHLGEAPTHPIDAVDEQPLPVLVRAERVGVFTLSSKIPADELDVLVKRGQELGVIKGLNVQERIQAPVSGTIARFHVTSGKMVEFGQPLLDIVPETAADELS
jgi:biotin carboxyl carrier protein